MVDKVVPKIAILARVVVLEVLTNDLLVRHGIDDGCSKIEIAADDSLDELGLSF